jgi:DNA primase
MLNSQVDEIKNRLDIVEVISGYIKLQKAGANFKATCPFHSEKTPSFMVSPSRQIWHCFGCGAGGDVFGFVMKMENLEFPEALKMLADKAGVVLRREDPKLRSEKTRLLEICETAAKFFEFCLHKKDFGKPVLEYLRGRGLKDETIGEFRIGFAPDTWDSLLRFLLSRGYKGENIEKVGLAIKSEKAIGSRQYYDRFRSRIMFPICNSSGQVVGFSGRIFEPEVPTRFAVGTPTSPTASSESAGPILKPPSIRRGVPSRNQPGPSPAPG